MNIKYGLKMTITQAFILGAMVAYTPSMLVLFFILRRDFTEDGMLAEERYRELE